MSGIDTIIVEGRHGEALVSRYALNVILMMMGVVCVR